MTSKAEDSVMRRAGWVKYLAPVTRFLTGDRAPLLWRLHAFLTNVALGVLQRRDHLAAEELDRAHCRLV